MISWQNFVSLCRAREKFNSPRSVFLVQKFPFLDSSFKLTSSYLKVIWKISKQLKLNVAISVNQILIHQSTKPTQKLKVELKRNPVFKAMQNQNVRLLD